MPITDSATFEVLGKTVTITREQYDALSQHDQDLIDQNWMMIQGKIIGTGEGGNFWKRWTNMFGEPRGYEFRPLRLADYGYNHDFDFWLSTSFWAFMTIGNFKVGIRQGAIVLATSMLLNDYVRPMFKDGQGSSFVSNVQGGFNLYHYLYGRNVSGWTKWAGIGVITSDLNAIAIEYYRDYEFNTAIATDVHVTGLGIGFVLGVMLNKMM